MTADEPVPPEEHFTELFAAGEGALTAGSARGPSRPRRPSCPG